MDNEDDLHLVIKNQDKEINLYKKRLSICTSQRQEMQLVMEQSRKLLENVLEEETLNQLKMFRKFVPKEFLQSLNKQSILDIKLGDHVQREMTILFSDIRGYSTLSENISAEDIFNFINAFLKRVEPPIHTHNGFVEKFIGDAILALFYTAEDALDAGIEMQHALRNYNISRVKRSYSPIKIGIGLHHGLTTFGIVGVDERMQGTVLSDAVNTSARLESLTKLYDSALILSESTLLEVWKKDKYKFRYLGKARVPGKMEKIKIFENLDAEEEQQGELKYKTKSYFEKGINLFYEQSFAEASVEFSRVLKVIPKEKAAELYFKQCAEYMIHGVPQEWDGAITHSKD